MASTTQLGRLWWSSTGDLPVVVRWAVRIGTVLGVLGALAGLVIGFAVNPPTAWFAVLELGVPAFLVGAVLGAIAGAAVGLVGAHERSLDDRG